MEKKEVIVEFVKNRIKKEEITEFISTPKSFGVVVSIDPHPIHVDEVLIYFEKAKKDGATHIDWSTMGKACIATPLKISLESDESYQNRFDKEVKRFTGVLEEEEIEERKELKRLQKKYKNQPDWKYCDCGGECMELDSALIKCKQGNTWKEVN